VLAALEAGHHLTSAPEAAQLALFEPEPPDPIVEELRALDVDGLTPRQAQAALADLADRSRRRGRGA
jgi:hypothetical protein